MKKVLERETSATENYTPWRDDLPVLIFTVSASIFAIGAVIISEIIW